MKPFAGKVAFVTGGTRGIGLATAREFARRGADVAISFFTNRTHAQNAQKELESYGVRVALLRGNVGNPEHVEQMFKNLEEKLGRLDFYVANAAMGVMKPLEELTLADWDRTMEVNVRSLMQAGQLSLKLMKKHGQGGRIVAISSMGAVRYIPNYAALGSAKAAIESLVRFLAVEFAPHKVLVNCVHAGMVDTDSLKRFQDREALLQDNLRRTPMGRLGTPEDIARTVAMLCGEEAGWIVGQSVVVDGGFSVNG
ncbi:MAG: SDR family oxidoreductase [Candidatus Eisenbacteria bacterium]|nr:SDR family oxidoreductase [Candidatus Eisenbacteria bacterium]